MMKILKRIFFMSILFVCFTACKKHTVVSKESILNKDALAIQKGDSVEELNPVSGVNNESYEGDEVEDEENTSNNKEIDYSFKTLKGYWGYDCENESGLNINNEELVIPVAFNQYYIH